MTGPEHYRRAEELIRSVIPGATFDDGTPIVYDQPHVIAAAQVHATLALAATTAASDPDEGWDDIRRDGTS